MATLEEVRSLMKHQKGEFVAPVKAEFASMKAELAREVLDGLCTLIQEEIANNSDALGWWPKDI